MTCFSYFSRDETESKTCEVRTESDSQKHNKVNSPDEKSSVSLSQPFIEITERIVPLAPLEDDLDDDVIESDETSG